LEVLDTGTNVITRYATAPFHPIGTLGPLPQDLHFGDCFPQAFGFNADESMLAVGDILCHATDVGDVSKNRFIAQLTWAFGPMNGAAFEPSDKQEIK
jgi:hypothetical protein